MGYEEEGEQMGEFVEGIFFGYRSGKDILESWQSFKTIKGFNLSKKETLEMIDNFIDVYQGVEGIRNIEELRRQINEEEQ